MNCAYYEERFSDYLENALPASEVTVVEQHLRSCADCAALLDGVRDVIRQCRSIEVPPPSPWLPSRIVANTPHVVRVTWADWARAAWRTVAEPRFALALLTSTLVLGTLGNRAGVTVSDIGMIRRPAAVYEGVEGWAQRIYGNAIRSYYSPIVSEIQCRLQALEQFRENS